MSDAVGQGIIGPAKKPAAKRPTYKVMIAAAITALNERGGSSRKAILRYIVANYNLGTEVAKINGYLKVSLKAGVRAGRLNQAKRTEAYGSFGLAEKKVADAKPKKVNPED